MVTSFGTDNVADKSERRRAILRHSFRISYIKAEYAPRGMHLGTHRNRLFPPQLFPASFHGLGGLWKQPHERPAKYPGSGHINSCCGTFKCRARHGLSRFPDVG